MFVSAFLIFCDAIFLGLTIASGAWGTLLERNE